MAKIKTVDLPLKEVEAITGPLVGGASRKTFTLNGRRYKAWAVDPENGTVECEVLD